MKIRHFVSGLSLSLFMVSFAFGQAKKPLQISGVYPHLAVFNEGNRIPCIKNPGNGIEIGIGAAVPWAGKVKTIPPTEMPGRLTAAKQRPGLNTNSLHFKEKIE